MTRSTGTPPTTPTRHLGGGRAMIPPSVTLAGWRLRRTWRLLLICGLGILAAAVIACTAPLYTVVARNAGIQKVLTESPDAAQLQVEFRQPAVSDDSLEQSKTTLSTFMQSQLGGYLINASQFMFESINYPVVSANASASANANTAVQNTEMNLFGVSIPQSAPHLRLLKGRLPQEQPTASSDSVEVALTKQNAALLHVSVGSTIMVILKGQLAGGPTGESVPFAEPLPLTVVGIFAPPGNDPFWHDVSLEPDINVVAHVTFTKAVISADAFVATLTNIARQNGGTAIVLADALLIDWYFYLDPHRITTDTLDDVIARLGAAPSLLAQTWNSVYGALDPTAPGVPFIYGSAISVNSSPSSLERFRDWATITGIPLNLLTVLILALLLFFVAQMASLLAERQIEALALLRSRGAWRRHIFGAFAAQCLGVGLLALLAGPPLGLLLTRLLSQATLAANLQSALAVTLGDPVQAMRRVVGFAALAAGAAALAMVLTAAGAARSDVLALRRESSRATRRPLWQRLMLDVLAAIIAVIGFGVSQYLTSSGALDARTLELLGTPLDLIAPALLLLAGALLFLRVLPWLLRLLSWIAAHRPSAPPMLALAQMARAPAASGRLILLLALAAGFAGFTLAFSAAEPLRIAQVAGQQVGADFSGALFTPPTTPSKLIAPSTAERPYQAIRGVVAVSAGFVTTGTFAVPFSNIVAPPIIVEAVDTHTFAQTGIWGPDDANQSLSSLFTELSKAPAIGTVPAVVDAVTWNTLHLTNGADFTLGSSGFQVGVTFDAIAEVQHIPGINDSSKISGVGAYTTPGGILVDFTTLSKIYNTTEVEAASQVFPPPVTTVAAPYLAPNHLWLRTNGDPATLARVRAALSAGKLRLASFQDRRALVDSMQRDPSSRALLGVLWLGTFTMLFLALVGTLLASWASVRSRLTTFALLRALGGDPRRIASVLAWEQGIIYALSLLLGSAIGVLLVLMAVPGLVSANPDTPANPVSIDALYVVQQVVSPHLVLPGTVYIGFAALLAICVAAVVMMARVVSRPSLSQTLRLNED